MSEWERQPLPLTCLHLKPVINNLPQPKSLNIQVTDSPFSSIFQEPEHEQQHVRSLCPLSRRFCGLKCVIGLLGLPMSLWSGYKHVIMATHILPPQSATGQETALTRRLDSKLDSRGRISNGNHAASGKGHSECYFSDIPFMCGDH